MMNCTIEGAICTNLEKSYKALKYAVAKLKALNYQDILIEEDYEADADCVFDIKYYNLLTEQNKCLKKVNKICRTCDRRDCNYLPVDTLIAEAAIVEAKHELDMAERTFIAIAGDDEFLNRFYS
jgi:hypothetical protein